MLTNIPGNEIDNDIKKAITQATNLHIVSIFLPISSLNVDIAKTPLVTFYKLIVGHQIKLIVDQT